MPRLVYLNGKFLPDVEAHISIFDRGFLFSDAVYEVTAVIDKKLVSWEDIWIDWGIVWKN